ncbi:MAG: NAD-dependent epimerase/dehydratase family protein [Candidatus Microbacterium colombiense]|nr:MAG: NAD-dependent epimerase/dehydratase family protein [Microbacterium sp.]
MTDVLILGGTGWLSGRIARRWVDEGASVTCLARGLRDVPAGASLIEGDRDRPGAYDAVAREWDHVIDISSRADHVAQAITAIGARTQRWTYISSMSVYADDTTAGADESAALHAPAVPGDAYDYAAEKVAAEQSVATLGARARIVRPGLIVGEGDPSDRFGYWAAAFARAGSDAVLLPPLEDRWVQVIDVDDLADFVVTTRCDSTPVNAIGDQHPLADVLARVRAAAGHTGATVEGAEDWLVGQGVGYWAGERSLPLWLPAEMTGFMTRSNAAFHRAGGRLRSIDDTIAAVVADEVARGTGRTRSAGLTRPQEQTLLDTLA